ncbi:hypothetical protein ESY86_05555 [Subsaximicrobium wynnwilliamsii]|uniref:Uncharacterized protein n=1 Tax=Subsaximicrobium wynnwilliamsii TaxID=291179 RepID=A0A5C6ZLD0_9FLAO|nr:hypothetical protein [Subsaximicrobium wynnwilliamsii]TXD84525.1 hypothetical protein ESY87_05330 [Subsaximicrobium wynnwilliamsii]TXD90207.1 hypothetical protein ESY86_05555 [Subsaximicrobium wynnwilliamsii]TXE04258.1 hypothetical protein ESY88_05325 [Subsaximicrobium wynnwilliamsii]
MGYGGQVIILIPDKELIIVTTHNHDTPIGIEQQIKFLKEKLPKTLRRICEFIKYNNIQNPMIFLMY